VRQRSKNIRFRIFNAQGNLASRWYACHESESFRRILHYKRPCSCNARDGSILGRVWIRSKGKREKESEKERKREKEKERRRERVGCRMQNQTI